MEARLQIFLKEQLDSCKKTSTNLNHTDGSKVTNIFKGTAWQLQEDLH